MFVLHNHPLYGQMYDDYVMKKHVLCNFCACTLDLFFWKPMELITPLRSIKGHRTLFILTCASVEIGRGCDCHTVDIQVTYYREKKLKRSQSLDSYLSCLGTPSIPTLSRLSENGRLWMGGSSIGTISMAKLLNQNMKVLSRLWKGPIRRLTGWVKAYRPFADKRNKVGMDGVPYTLNLAEW